MTRSAVLPKVPLAHRLSEAKVAEDDPSARIDEEILQFDIVVTNAETLEGIN